MLRRQTQPFVLGIFIGISLVLIFYVLGSFAQKHSLKKYKSFKDKFSISYPFDWGMRENVEGASVVFFSPMENEFDIFQENVNIVVQEVPEKLTDLDKYTETAIRQMKAVFKDKLIVLESAPAHLSGFPAHKFLYLGKGPETELKIMHIWTIRGKYAYQFTYSAISSKFDQYVNKVEKMLRSFKIE